MLGAPSCLFFALSVPEVLLRGILLDPEEFADVGPGLLDSAVVVLDELSALAHQALLESVHDPGVLPVVGDGEKPRPVVVPGQRLGVMPGAHFAQCRP